MMTKIFKSLTIILVVCGLSIIALNSSVNAEIWGGCPDGEFNTGYFSCYYFDVIYNIDDVVDNGFRDSIDYSDSGSSYYDGYWDDDLGEYIFDDWDDGWNEGFVLTNGFLPDNTTITGHTGDRLQYTDAAKTALIDEMILYLQDQYNSGDDRRITGASYIVHSMLGRAQPKGDKTVASSDWDDLRARMDGVDIWVKYQSPLLSQYHETGMGIDDYGEYDVYKIDGHDEYIYPSAYVIFGDFDAGTVYYEIDTACANPNGFYENGLPIVTPALVWSVATGTTMKSASGSDILSDGSVSPGDEVIWTHKVWNDSSNPTTVDVEYYAGHQDTNMETGVSEPEIKPFPFGAVSHWLPSGAVTFAPASFTSSRTITQADVGHRLCRTTTATPSVSYLPGSVTDSTACVYVPYNYELMPSVETNPTGVVEPNSSHTITPKIKNNGPTKSRPFEWQLSYIQIKPGSFADNEAGGDSATEPCSYFNNANASCPDKKNGNDPDGVAVGDNVGGLNNYQDVINGTLEPGTRICYALSIKPYSSVQTDDSVWRHSKLTCIKIGKKPKVQVWGGNVIVGDNISTSSTIKKDGANYSLFGSWGEYGVFAFGNISGMASGSALAGTVDPTSPSFNFCDYSKLSFSNTPNEVTACNDSTIGGYTFGTVAGDPSASFAKTNDISAGTIDIDVNALLMTPGLYVGEKTGNLTLSASTLQEGKTVVLKINGNVTIEGNLSYENITYRDASKLPQLIISANNIYINGGVTNIDAWLISKNEIDTCKNFSGNLTISKCSNKLVVNGPVITKKLILNRTAGSGGDLAESGSPAETFNLRADAFLWAASRASSKNVIYTVYLNELSPRF